jgi:Protein of unknown function (DUF2851)
MNESFLHYIWQFQYFDKRDLITSSGEKIEVFKIGNLNTHAGPDFSNAKIRIGDLDWAGAVEIHTKSSAWEEHHHEVDKAYDSVILHVVWQDDRPVYRSDKTLMPTLELKGRVDEGLIKEYKKLVNSPATIPCEKSFSKVDELTKISMLDKALMQRLETKALQAEELLKTCNNDWDETTYRLFARNFGFKVNNEPFEQLAKSVTYKTILKHADKPVQVEAILFGQAGFLDIEVGDDYYKLLQREYRMLSKKYNLESTKLKKSQWRFLRLRPANFPTVRIAQLGALLRQKGLFSKILDIGDFKSISRLFSSSPSPYWQHHYQFNKKSEQGVAGPGSFSIENLIINSAVPLLVAYGRTTDDHSFLEKATNLLLQIPGEKNGIIRTWNNLGFVSKTAFDSQGLIELHNNFCLRRNCLNCNIGASLLKPNR